MEEANEIIETIKESGDPETQRIHDIEFNGDLKANFKATLESINSNKPEDAILLICGSVFIMEGVKNLLK